MPIQTLATIKHARARVERRRSGTAFILSKMECGATLHMYFAKSGPVWFLSDGTTVPCNIAEIVTNNPNIAGIGDSLFPHFADVSQTFRYVDSYKGENHDD